LPLGEDIVYQALGFELSHTDIHGQGQVPHGVLVCPLCELTTGSGQGPTPHRLDQASLLSERNEFRRRNDSSLWVNLAQQRFRTERAPPSVDLLLVVELKLLLIELFAKFPRGNFCDD
jgi:hypothetical protein